MSDFNKEIYNEIKQNFLLIAKRILKKELSTNKDTLKRYESDIVASYNDITAHLNTFFEKYDKDFDEFLRNEIIYIREKTLKCFGKLDIRIKLPNDLFTTLDNKILTDISDSSDTSDNEVTLIEQNIIQNISRENDFQDIEDSFYNSSHSILNNMTGDETIGNGIGNGDISANNTTRMTRLEFIRVASQTINKNYSGDPLALNAFINAITLAKQLSDGLFDDFLKTFILTKLEGKALECVDQDGTINQIIADLKKNIKPDNSKVVSGRMLAMKLGKLSPPDFSKQAEELAEALQRSLIVEGIGREKAKEMAIEKTVEMCRQSAKTDVVRSVLAAATFKDPKEVIAKLITEQATSETERQILSFRANNYRGRGFNRNFNNNRNPNFRRFNNNNNNNFRNNRGNSNWRGNSYGNRGNRNFRGNQNNNRNYNVRVAENSTTPSEGRGNNSGNNNASNNANQASVFTLHRLNHQ